MEPFWDNAEAAPRPTADAAIVFGSGSGFPLLLDVGAERAVFLAVSRLCKGSSLATALLLLYVVLPLPPVAGADGDETESWSICSDFCFSLAAFFFKSDAIL